MARRKTPNRSTNHGPRSTTQIHLGSLHFRLSCARRRSKRFSDPRRGSSAVSERNTVLSHRWWCIRPKAGEAKESINTRMRTAMETAGWDDLLVRSGLMRRRTHGRCGQSRNMPIPDGAGGVAVAGGDGIIELYRRCYEITRGFRLKAFIHMFSGNHSCKHSLHTPFSSSSFSEYTPCLQPSSPHPSNARRPPPDPLYSHHSTSPHLQTPEHPSSPSPSTPSAASYSPTHSP